MKWISRLRYAFDQQEIIQEIIKNKTFNHLFSRLKFNKCIKELDFCFDELNYSKIVYISHAIVNLKTVSKLKIKLVFFDNLLQEKDISVLYKTLRTLKSIECLDIWFGGHVIERNALKILFNTFKYLALLVSLRFRLCGPTMNVNSLNYLLTTLSQLKSLSTLHICCPYIKYIKRRDTITTKMHFAPLKEIKTLTDIYLNFYNSKALLDEDIKDLCLTLKDCNSLSKVHLELSGCKKITDESIKGINEFVNERQNLLSLTLNIEKCKKISGKAKSNLRKSLKIINSHFQVIDKKRTCSLI